MKHEYPGEYRFKTISRYFAYHGTTLATLDAGGMGERKAKFEPFSGDFVHVAQPYCYRCPFGLSYPSCGLACVKNMENTILGEGPETVAAVIVEPISSVPGCCAAGILGRAGEPMRQVWHPAERGRGDQRLRPHRQDVRDQHYGMAPDIIAIAKGISSAYMPIAATVVKNSVFDSFYGDPAHNRQVGQVNTYGGHPAAAAVALRNIEIIEAERLADRPAVDGRIFA